jgi:hypothetical protein
MISSSERKRGMAYAKNNLSFTGGVAVRSPGGGDGDLPDPGRPVGYPVR